MVAQFRLIYLHKNSHCCINIYVPGYNGLRVLFAKFEETILKFEEIILKY